jgi:hypothetical protein
MKKNEVDFSSCRLLTNVGKVLIIALRWKDAQS